jgi:hypothetical protein
MDIPRILESASNIGFREKLSYPLLMRNSIISFFMLKAIVRHFGKR